jgi:hypothetical protein
VYERDLKIENDDELEGFRSEKKRQETGHDDSSALAELPLALCYVRPPLPLFRDDNTGC